jgi:peptidoglycan/LPS O-acetylase OafA/YrhL
MESWLEKDAARKLMYMMFAVVAALMLVVWGIGIMEGRTDQVRESVLRAAVMFGIPLLVYFLVPASKQVRASAAIAAMVAADALATYVLGLADQMWFVENWEITAVLAGSAAIAVVKSR